MFYQIFFLPKVKRSIIISKEHDIYESLDLKNLENIKKISKLYEIIE